jgi:hypothetical protein
MFDDTSYRELQRIAKRRGVPANSSREEIINQILKQNAKKITTSEEKDSDCIDNQVIHHFLNIVQNLTLSINDNHKVFVIVIAMLCIKYNSKEWQTRNSVHDISPKLILNVLCCYCSFIVLLLTFILLIWPLFSLLNGFYDRKSVYIAFLLYCVSSA